MTYVSCLKVNAETINDIVYLFLEFNGYVNILKNNFILSFNYNYK